MGVSARTAALSAHTAVAHTPRLGKTPQAIRTVRFALQMAADPAAEAPSAPVIEPIVNTGMPLSVLQTYKTLATRVLRVFR